MNQFIDKFNWVVEHLANSKLTGVYTLVGIFLFSYIGWLIIKKIIAVAKIKTEHYQFIQDNPQIFSTIQQSLFFLLLFTCGTFVLKVLKLNFIEKVFVALLIVCISVPLKTAAIVILKYLEEKFAAKTETKVDNIIFDLLNKFSGAIIFVTATILALDALGINVMPFVAGAGVAGIAIGFAAKDTLSNLIAGVLLIIDRPFEIGDRIEVWSAPVGSSTWGDVIDIGIRATKIRTTDHIVIIIPNNEIMKRDIVNYTIMSTMIRVRINVGVSYDSNVQVAKDAIIKVASSAGWIEKNPPPKVVVRNFGDSSIDLQARVWIRDARKRMDTISYITDNVKTEFDKQGIEIPYPKRDITIVQKN